MRQIGEELGVAHLLEGSVSRSGNKVRVTAQLVDARNDQQLWEIGERTTLNIQRLTLK